MRLNHRATLWWAMLFVAACISPAVSAAEPRMHVSTPMGVVRVVPSDEVGALDTLQLNNARIFSAPGMYLRLYGAYPMGQALAVLLDVDCGGSSCPPAELHFILLSKGQAAKDITASAFQSHDGRVSARSSGDRVIVDLGHVDGKRKTAILEGDQLTVTLSPPVKTAMSRQDCDFLYDAARDCIGQRQCSQLPEYNYIALSLAAVNSIRGLSNEPGFNAPALAAACISQCETGAPMPLQQFRTRVCSIRGKDAP